MPEPEDTTSQSAEPPETGPGFERPSESGTAVTTRRQFLELAGAAGLGLLLGGAIACSPEKQTVQLPPGTTRSLQSPTTSAVSKDPGPQTTFFEPPQIDVSPPTETPVTSVTADVCVVGGGAAGMAAATVAAAMGARTVLLEESWALGGNVTRGLVSFDRVAWGGELMVGGWFTDIIRRLEQQGDARFPGPSTNFTTPCDADALRAMALTLAQEAGVDIRFGSKATWTEVSDGRIVSVWASEHGSLTHISAPIFIDCTGDGNLGHMAGCGCWLGDGEESSIQGQTLIFCVGPVDYDRLSEYAAAHGSQVETYRIVGLRRFMSDIRRSGEVEGSPQEGLLIDRNMWPDLVSISGSETYGDHLQPGSLAEITAQLQRQNRQIHTALREYVPGFENSRIVRMADRPYLREGRRLTGHYQLSIDDIRKALKPDDSIARGYYPIDLHRDGKVGIVQSVHLRPGDWYGIPYGCIVAQDVDNLLMAGRCISVTHEALGSTRISPVSIALGQAAGIAAALSTRRGVHPAELPPDEVTTELHNQGALT